MDMKIFMKEDHQEIWILSKEKGINPKIEFALYGVCPENRRYREIPQMHDKFDGKTCLYQILRFWGILYPIFRQTQLSETEVAPEKKTGWKSIPGP